MRVLRIIGVFYLIDGVSLLWRGVVGGLFLLHESSTLAFILIYISHVYLGGAIYAYFGYGLITNKTWSTKLAGFVLAITSIIWAIPLLGADYFTAALGLYFLIIMQFFHNLHKNIESQIL